MAKNKLFVIIGNSAAGLAAMEAIRRVDKTTRIINISKEPHRPYSRCLLSYYLAGGHDRDILWIRPEDYYSRLNIEPLLNADVVHVDAGDKTVRLKNNKKITFDKLLIASGASAKSVDADGVDKKGVFVMRTLQDADCMIKMLPGVKKVCILGGGLVGMRMAHALKKRGINPHVIVKSSHIFSQILDAEAADILRQHLELNGIEISTGLAVKKIIGGEAVKGIVLDDGNELDCQMVVIGKGVAANIDMVKGEIKTDNGILTNEYLQTDTEGIYAAGDAAETYDILEERMNVNQIWPAAVSQGRVAGLNMAGKKIVYAGSYGMNSVDFFGMAVMSFGMVKPEDDEYKELIIIDTRRVLYRKVVLKGGRIVGGVLINDVDRHGVLLHLALQKVNVNDIKEILADEYFDIGKVMPLIKRQASRFTRPEYKDITLTYSPLY